MCYLGAYLQLDTSKNFLKFLLAINLGPKS